MRAVAIDAFGGPDRLRLRDLPVPEAGAGEALIRVPAAGVGVWDARERAGASADRAPAAARFPRVLGAEGAGTVAAVGAGVTEFRAGATPATPVGARPLPRLPPRAA